MSSYRVNDRVPIIFVFDSKYYNETTISNILNRLLELEGRSYEDFFGKIQPAIEVTTCCNPKDLAVLAYEIPYWMRLYLDNLHNVKGYSCLTL